MAYALHGLKTKWIGRILCIPALLAILSVLIANPFIRSSQNQGFIPSISAQEAPSIREDITLSFVIENNYAVRLEGKIVLTNVSGKDAAIGEYELLLPIVKLKNTKITRITPDIFLIDTYRENNSNLFKIKSSQTKSVVIRNNGSATFHFQADIDAPFKEYGQLKILDLPFQVDSTNRHIDITVDVDKSLPMILSPDDRRSEWNTYRFHLSDEDGKTFAFMMGDMSMTLKRTSDREVVHALRNDSKDQCISHSFVSCENCGDGFIDSQSNVTFTPKETNKPVILTTNVFMAQQCLTERFIQQGGAVSTDPAQTVSTKIVGLVLYPDVNIVIPAEWDENFDIKTNTLSFFSRELRERRFPYSWDYTSAFHISIGVCESTSQCNILKDELANMSKSISPTAERFVEKPLILGLDDIDIAIVSPSFGRYELEILNKSNSLGVIEKLELINNNIFQLAGNDKRAIPPGGVGHIDLIPKSRIPVRNLPSEILLNINGFEKKTTYSPEQNLLLDIIYILGIVFFVVLGIFILSFIYIVMYNKKYGIQKSP
ncbi:MAG: hypothetical protein QY314_04310 [Candidatus Dojkabacteria bacterium]|nr:MAG: hypothetical protein QY314_04310 [Candidatus Dojkabacteria bacterium]